KDLDVEAEGLDRQCLLGFDDGGWPGCVLRVHVSPLLESADLDGMESWSLCVRATRVPARRQVRVRLNPGQLARQDGRRAPATENDRCQLPLQRVGGISSLAGAYPRRWEQHRNIGWRS